MEVYKTIIHQIKKEQGVLEAHLNPSDDLLQIDNNVEDLVENLNNSFKKESRIMRTEFLESNNEYFQSDLKISMNGSTGINTFTDDSFKKLSDDTIKTLQLLIMNHPFVSGGYYVYSHYSKFGRNYLGIFLVRDAKKVNFTRDTKKNVFVVNTTTIIDTDKLAMACRIDIEKYRNNEDRFLHFTNYKQSEISEYFIKWLEANLASKSDDDTTKFLSIIDNIDLPIDPETNKTYQEDKFRNMIHASVTSTGGILRLKELGSLFWNNENFILDYIEENDIDINNEFRVKKATFNYLNKFSFSYKKLNIGFTKGDWNICKVRTAGTDQIIIESKELKDKIETILNGK